MTSDNISVITCVLRNITQDTSSKLTVIAFCPPVLCDTSDIKTFLLILSMPSTLLRFQDARARCVFGPITASLCSVLEFCQLTFLPAREALGQLVMYRKLVFAWIGFVPIYLSNIQIY